MPANKNAYIRYKALDECFRDWGKQYTWEKLQDYVERAVAKEGVTQGESEGQVSLLNKWSEQVKTADVLEVKQAAVNVLVDKDMIDMFSEYCRAYEERK